MQRRNKKVFKEPIFLAHERDCGHYEGEKLKAHTALVNAKISFALVPVEGMGPPVLLDENWKAWNGLTGIEDYIRSRQPKTNKPHANLLGDFKRDGDKIEKAKKLFSDAGYETHWVPCEGILEINVFPVGKEPIRITDLRVLKDFLDGKPVERSMWTLV